MPTVNPFALIHNFASVQDVSGYDYWTTLGGFNKDSTGSPTQAQINASMQSAYKLYLMWYSVTAPSSATDTRDGFTDASISSINTVDDLVLGDTNPQKRRIYNSTTASKSITGINSVQLYGGFTPPLRLYDGVTTNESNFVGYGAAWGYTYASGQSGSSKVRLLSSIQNKNTSGSYYTYSYAYVTLSGMHFLCEAYGAQVSPSTGSHTANASNLSASSYLQFETGDDPPETETARTYSDITSIDFYTIA